jgi:hypothetical protein
MKNMSVMSVINGIVIIIVSVVSTMAWMDSHFVTLQAADRFAEKKKVDKLERIIIFQQLTFVQKDIDTEKKKPAKGRDTEKLHLLYEQEAELKKELGVK